MYLIHLSRASVHSKEALDQQGTSSNSKTGGDDDGGQAISSSTLEDVAMSTLEILLEFRDVAEFTCHCYCSLQWE